jgi:predicted secreted acid phosphatase
MRRPVQTPFSHAGTGRSARRLRVRRCALLLLAPLLTGCAFVEPANLGDLKGQLRAYHENGYQQGLEAVGSAAQDWVRLRAPQVTKPALVLDIDETSLSNWQQLDANDFGYITGGPCAQLPKGPCGTYAWDRTGAAAAIGPTLELFKVARAAGVAVFFITGRYDTERAATARNLRIAGYIDKDGRDGWAALIMRPAGTKAASAADFKAPERAKIEMKGYTIIANVGDQPSDLAGGHAERSFLLPDPFYRVP